MATDAHATPAAPATTPKKTGPAAKVWGIIGVVIGVLLGVVVLFYVIRYLLPEAFAGLIASLSILSTVLTQSGVGLNMVGSSVGIFAGGGFALYIRVMIYVLMFLGVGWMISYLMGKMKKSDGGAAPH